MGWRRNGTRKRAPYRHEEEAIQKTMALWLGYCLLKPWIYHHSRNGGLSKAENGRAKAMGARAGFPDLIVMGVKDVGDLMPKRVPWTWLIEVKTETGRLSNEQIEFRRDANKLGFSYVVVRSLDDLRYFAKGAGWPIREIGWEGYLQASVQTENPGSFPPG